jgi:hypothetical protein
MLYKKISLEEMLRIFNERVLLQWRNVYIKFGENLSTGLKTESGATHTDSTMISEACFYP